MAVQMPTGMDSSTPAMRLTMCEHPLAAPLAGLLGESRGLVSGCERVSELVDLRVGE
ncbi:hypothetical protein [Nonomuraea sp. NPDC049684]|uniref:hypothetical protein n=1 Tax=Nonomuraea sp. NPDC049684 TaxID=3364356 RepID=UPI0037A34903